MLKLKVTKQLFRRQLDYYKKGYIWAIIIAICAFSIVFSATKPQTPPTQKLTIFMMEAQPSEKGMQALEEKLLAVLPEDQVEVNVIGIASQSSGDYTLIETLLARMMGGEGDIFVIPQYAYDVLAWQGPFYVLDDYLGEMNIPEGYDTMRLYAEYEAYNEEGKSQEYKGICAVPAYQLEGLLDMAVMPEDFLIDEKDFNMVISVANYSPNRDNAIAAVRWMLENMVERHSLVPKE